MLGPYDFWKLRPGPLPRLPAPEAAPEEEKSDKAENSDIISWLKKCGNESRLYKRIITVYITYTKMRNFNLYVDFNPPGTLSPIIVVQWKMAKNLKGNYILLEIHPLFAEP